MKKDYREKIVSNNAVVTGEIGRFIQITCKDLPYKHHNRIVNLPKYVGNLSIGDTGKVVYNSGPTYGILSFIKD